MGIRLRHAAHSDAPFIAGSLHTILLDGLSKARTLAKTNVIEDRLGFARGMVFAAMSAYWEKRLANDVSSWPIQSLPDEVKVIPATGSAADLAETIGMAAAKLNVMDASYVIGVLYTGLIPGNFRSELGAYYTPPALCERLLTMATEAGVDWRTARVLDPACGGGAFLSPVAQRMAENMQDCSATTALNSIIERLRGFELDRFSAWLSQVFLEITLGGLCRITGRRLPNLVRTCNSLEQHPEKDRFDLVIGNPPYGRITLTPELREKYRRSLFGHANLYGLFTDLALRFTSPNGVIAYVTPTSFLAGEYFKALRALIGREAPPISIDFVQERKGVFTDVLQETLLAAYRRGSAPRAGKVHFISSGIDGSIKSTPSGSFFLPKNPEQPWLMPRSKTQSALVRKVGGFSHRLIDYGYKVCTGPLVWNRHRLSLRDSPGKGRYPLIWAESVRPEGKFEFRAEKRNHKPYFEPSDREYWVVTDFPCVLLQRTTAKEQCRRLIAAELPESFISDYGAVVVENHLNMIKPINCSPKVSLSALASLLNSDVVDQVFRCINGSVAVSAYEMEALPLPSPEIMQELEQLVRQRATRVTLERTMERLYGTRVD